jgi:hypothetical protein
MTEKLYLAPATRGSGAYHIFKKSVQNGVSPDLYSDLTDTELNGTVSVWGIKSSMLASWQSIDIGDWLLFYTKRNEYEYAARVIDKDYNRELGDKIRSELFEIHNRDERDWDLLVFLDKPVSVSITGKELADLLGYGNYYPVRFLRVTEERLENIKSRYGNPTKFVGHIRES